MNTMPDKVGKLARRLVIAIAIAAAGGLSGCADTRYVFRYGVETMAAEQRAVWPAPPQVPRYRYAGQLIGEANFEVAEDQGTSNFLRRAFEWLVGVFEDDGDIVTLQRPVTGAVDALGRIYVTDASRAAVYMFDTTGGRIQVWDHATDREKFVSPVGIVVAPENQVWVADADRGEIVRLNGDGVPVGSFGRGMLQRPTGMAWDESRRVLFVADTGEHAIFVFDEKGAFVERIGQRGEGPGEFNFPSHIAVARGKLYVADTMNARVQIFSTVGEYLGHLGHRGLFVGELVRPKGVAVDGDGNIYVIEGYHDHLLIYNQSKEFLLPIGGTGKEVGKFFLPAGVWIHGNDRVFVADMFNGRVMVFEFLGGDS